MFSTMPKYSPVAAGSAGRYSKAFTSALEAADCHAKRAGSIQRPRGDWAAGLLGQFDIESQELPHNRNSDATVDSSSSRDMR